MSPKMKFALEILTEKPIVVSLDSQNKVIGMSVDDVSIVTLRALDTKGLVKRRLLSLSKDIYEIVK